MIFYIQVPTMVFHVDLTLEQPLSDTVSIVLELRGSRILLRTKGLINVPRCYLSGQGLR